MSHMIQVDEELFNRLLDAALPTLMKAIKDDDDYYRNEMYNQLSATILSQVSVAVDALDDAKLSDFVENQKLKDKFFDNLEKDMDKIVDRNFKDTDELLDTLYSIGRRNGLTDLGLKRQDVWSTHDEESIKAIHDYNLGLVKDVSEDLRKQIRTEVYKGVIDGRHPTAIARDIEKIPEFTPLEGTTLTAYERAVMIARTETARAKNTGKLQTFQQFNVDKVKIAPAMGACDECEELANESFTLDEAADILPVHPNCCCTFVPDMSEYDDIFKLGDNEYSSVDMTED